MQLWFVNFSSNVVWVGRVFLVVWEVIQLSRSSKVMVKVLQVEGYYTLPKSQKFYLVRNAFSYCYSGGQTTNWFD